MEATYTLAVKRADEIHPYANNPRNNDKAVDAVIASIKQCGYIDRIIVDENMEILAGHTRFKALQKLGYENIQVAIVEGLTDEQKKKYRILDNKTGEIATWNIPVLAVELEDLDFEGFDFNFSLPDIEAIDMDDGFELEAEAETETKKICHCPKCGFTFEVN